MKSTRHRPKRRTGWSGERERERHPWKKALLIGIQYQGDQSVKALKAPHSDVRGMRDLLVDLYSYAPEDIVVLVDSDEPGQKQPTRENILREISRLVEGARAGDCFFFHYAGHADQVENLSSSEEDGWDECITPCDGKEAGLIKDNELRRLLVDPLPNDSNLIAIFDSCHSASLLDLEHFRCNRVYVPWISKGERRSDTRLNNNIRRGALPVSHGISTPNIEEITQVLSHRVTQSRRMSATSRQTSRDEILVSDSSGQRGLTVHTRSPPPDERWFETPYFPIKRCASPEPIWPCTGDCLPVSPRKANVISIAACKDNQLSWEHGDGASMTKVLIRILREHPYPTLHELITRISHELHRLYVHLHDAARNFRRKTRKMNKARIARGRPPRILSQPPEMDNFQDPQLSSHRPLNRDAKWNP